MDGEREEWMEKERERERERERKDGERLFGGMGIYHTGSDRATVISSHAAHAEIVLVASATPTQHLRGRLPQLHLAQLSLSQKTDHHDRLRGREMGPSPQPTQLTWHLQSSMPLRRDIYKLRGYCELLEGYIHWVESRATRVQKLVTRLQMS